MKHPVVLLGMFVVGFLGSRSVASQDVVKLEISDGVPVVDGVLLNGNGPYRFMLDTGSQSNQIDPETAAKLGIKTTLEIVLNTPSGKSRVGGGRVDMVTLGPMQAADQEFLLTSFDGVRKHCPGVVGMLGQEFLAKFDYLLDLRHRELVPMRPPPMGLRVPVRLIHGSMAVATNLGELIMDSGAQTTLLFRSSMQEPNGWITSAEGSLMPVSTEARVLQIGGRIYRVDKANFVPVRGAEEAGLLPANMFRAIYFCNSKGYVVLDPRVTK